jgi:outer membrane protein OmpA-like peptidoglycan-associated protein
MSTKQPIVLASFTNPQRIAVQRTKGIGVSILVGLLVLSLGACTTTDAYTREEKTSNTAKGAGIGAVGGAIAGAIFSGKRKAVLLGAGIGALVGGGIGNYMDREEAKLRAQLENTGVSVTRDGDNIILNMPSNITYAVDSSDISADFYPVLNSVSLVLQEFQQTYIDIIGHTDSTGRADYNQQLSERRADSVSRYLQSQGVMAERILTRGMGQDAPIASNDTAQGRAANRRVEIVLSPIT